MSNDLDSIRDRLEVISEELTDLAIVRLRESIDSDETELLEEERRLTRARRSIEKAVGLLSDPSDPSDP